MQREDGNNENIPTSPRLSLLQIPNQEPLSPQSSSPHVPIQGPENSKQGDISSLPPPSAQSQNIIHGNSSPSSSHSSKDEYHSSMPATTTTIMSHSVSSSQKIPLCAPLSLARLSSSSTRIPWPEPPSLMPPQQPPLCHQSSMMPYYPPIGVPPPFPFFPMPYPHDQFHYPMIPGNINASNGQIYSQPWSTGFITCLCPCVTFGQVDEMLSEGKMTWWEGALMFGLLETIFFGQASFIFAWYHRVQFRKKYNLMGNLLSEFAITLCCTRLVLCQNYRQLNKLGFDVALGWKANKKKQRRIESQGAVQFVPPMANPGMFR
ncbi:hypothetical protein RND71_032055 [Anisodus tanguticus]|uniref:Uncharacterized protein n=1 Tax=Anisodus tanguticus TaxID=243964 RepID=A0AAE1V6C7_9SOLA|nr:hypothetical protein RND71_032055 [Anisodus tanguticus]